MKKIVILAALAAVAMTSCSKEGDNVSQTNAIEFRGVTEKTRASLVDGLGEFTNFFVHAYKEETTLPSTFDFMAGTPVHRTAPLAATWTYSPVKYYPTDGSYVSFYAYAPIKDINMTNPVVAAGEVSFDYTVPADQSVSNTATDLLVAAAPELTAGTVAFVFDHALSAVNFTATSAAANPQELIFTISKAEIIEVFNEGTFEYDNTAAVVGTWATTGSEVTYKSSVRNVAVAVGDSETLLSANDYLMVLPQDVTASSKVVITYSVMDGAGDYIYNNEELELDFPVTFTAFEMGKRYNFTFTFDTTSGSGLLNPIVFDVTTLNNWVDETESLD